MVGRNGAGKTNILRAIDWIARRDTSEVRLPFQRSPMSAAIDAVAEETHFRYTVNQKQAFLKDSVLLAFVETLSVKLPNGDWDLLLLRENEELKLLKSDTVLKIGRSLSAIQAMFSILPSEDDQIARIRPFRDFLARVRYTPLSVVCPEDQLKSPRLELGTARPYSGMTEQ